MHLHLRLGIGLIYHMNDVVRIFGFFQGTLEGFYQIVGKLPDKSYSIRKKKLLSVIQCQKTCGRVQRGKKAYPPKAPTHRSVYSEAWIFPHWCSRQ